ncbi:MAG: cyclase family protein [Oscillospiraceae bacterium]
MNIIDISTDLLTAQVFDGDPAPKIQRLSRMDCGDEFELSALYSSLHTATHIDAPLHFIEDGDSVDKLDMGCFVGACTVIELPKGMIAGVTIEQLFPRSCERLLIKSGGNAHFMAGAVEDACNLGLKLIGTDGLSIGKGEEDSAVHRAFLNNAVPILEGLDLSQVKAGKYFLIALPVKICGAEASFCRAVLIDDHIFWGG